MEFRNEIRASLNEKNAMKCNETNVKITMQPGHINVIATKGILFKTYLTYYHSPSIYPKEKKEKYLVSAA